MGHIESIELLELARPAEIEVIYDIGANVGTWALLAKSVIPEATVEAFEPLPKHHADLYRNLRHVSGISLHPIALGQQNTTAILRVTDFSDASSLLPLAKASQVRFGVNEVEQFGTEVWRLDEYRVEKELPFPDLIKLDVQGYELEVLKGAPECLRSAKAVLTEVSFIEIYEGQCFFHDVVGWLAGFGFFPRIFGVSTPVGETLEQADLLFTRPWW